MRSKSWVLDKVAGLVIKVVEKHISAVPHYVLRWPGRESRLRRDRGHVCLVRLLGGLKGKHKALTVSLQRKSNGSSCGSHSNVSIGLAHSSAVVHAEWLKAHSYHLKRSIHQAEC